MPAGSDEGRSRLASDPASASHDLVIAGIQPTTLVDYPGLVAAVVFTAGCGFRCPFCHNPELVLPERVRSGPTVDEASVLATLAERSGFLDGVVITGGEPTLHRGLARFAERIKDLGLRVKLDTNGTRPDVLDRLFDRGLLDYVAMDIKAPPDLYERYAGVRVDLAAIEASIERIVRRAPEHEFRTTVAPGLSVDDIERTAEWLNSQGARRYALQRFRVPDDKGLVDASWEGRSGLDADDLQRAWERIAGRFSDGRVRA